MKSKKHINASIMSAFIALVFASTVSASGFHTKGEHKFGSKQYGYSQVWLDATGKGKLYSKYSNCHRIDGDTYATFAVLKDTAGQELGVVEIRAGMNAYPVGCNERELEKQFQVPESVMPRVASIQIIHREINSRDDGKIIGYVIAIIQEILENPPKPEEDGVHWKS